MTERRKARCWKFLQRKLELDGKTERRSVESFELRKLLSNINMWAVNCGNYERVHRDVEKDLRSSEYHRGAKEAFWRVADELRRILK